MSHIFSRIDPLYLHIRCRHRELRDSLHIIIVIIVFILQILRSRVIDRKHKELVDQGNHHRRDDPKDHGTGGNREIEIKIPNKDHCKLADVTAALDRLLPQYGFSEWSMEDTYSYNYASDDMSWYNTDQDYYLSRDGEYVGSITIYADTATDDLHGIGAYSSDEEAFYQIVDVLEATFQEFGYLDTDLSGQEVYQELINTEDMIVSKTDDSVNGFTTAYGPEIFASKESPSGDDSYSIQMYAPGYYTSVE